MQTVFPTGTTIYKPEKCFNGFTLYPSKKEGVGAVLIDMNGNALRTWPKFNNFMVNMLPGGHILGGQTGRIMDAYDHNFGADDVVQEAWDGTVEWQFGDADQMEFGGETHWSARQNHDIVREGCPVGYYVPGMTPMAENGRTLMLSYRTGEWPDITRDFLPRATRMIEVTWNGEITWDWMPAENFEQFGWSESAKNAIMRRCRNQNGVFQNTASYLGPNKWFDEGDERFDPENIITDDRGTMVYIISKKTGEIVWKVGPEYGMDPALKALGCIIGPHHAHIIPKGLPGEGNVLVFDNGGAAGYGEPNPGAPDGTWNALRDHSRVLEFNPLTLEIVWEFTAMTMGFPEGEEVRFYSRYESAAQRLPNGNTLITESRRGRVLEVTPACEIVWEYICPYNLLDQEDLFFSDIFRAYRYPYDWVPQIEPPAERAVVPPANGEFRIAPVSD
ncbi:MAG: arylsulfotransferase family protein [Alphaproteobacteria bacterium]|nr:arylsulfotransferase family protein [Alphaproteobacteria bacterium]